MSDSVLLLVESKSKDWFYEQMEPWVHYVPVKDDFSDIFKQIEYLRTHDEEAKEIGING